MKIILDTNVLISGIFFKGPPNQILKAWQEGKIQLVISEEILTEYKRVVEDLSQKYPAIEINQILELITIYSEVIDTKDFKVSVCEDPDDNKFLSCALSSKSNIIVSGDKHLLEISGFQGLIIIKPRDFIDNYLKNK